MARKPSIILTATNTVYQKVQGLKNDLRAELKAAKTRLKVIDSGIKSATNLAAAVSKEITTLEAKIAAME